jgi:thiamine-phosphate pyrophosphorylase
MLGSTALIGRSTHSLPEVAAALQEGADYVVFGPIWPTPGKGPALGIDALREASLLAIPVLALGGVETHRIPEAAAAGAWGVAGIRCCADPRELAGVVAVVEEAFGSLEAGEGSTIISP